MSARMLKGLLVALLAAVPLCAAAQDWPTKPVKFVVPFPPGGSVDPLARLTGAKLGDALKQQFVVENRAGAGGAIGMEAVIRGPHDGYTLVMMPANLAIMPALYEKLSFDALKDVTPIVNVVPSPTGIGGHPSRHRARFPSA